MRGAYPMSYFTTTLNSTVNISDAANLDWRQNLPVTAIITSVSCTSGSVFLQYTLDDLSLTANPVWSYLSSVPGTSVVTTFNSSYLTVGPTFLVTAAQVTFNYPIAGLRMLASASSANALTMRVLQPDKQ